jgi:hypothetical protein
MQLSLLACQQLLPKSRQDLVKSGADEVHEFKVDDKTGVIIFRSTDQFFIAPYVKDSDYRRAEITDCVSAKMLSNPLPTGLRSNLEIGKYKTERLITADQSNQSVVIDESIIIKWQLVAKVSQDAKKQELLSKNGFTQLPKLLGNIYWQDYLIASVNRYIKEAQDGWSWCVDYANSGNSSSWVDQLAQLTNQMHLALAGEIHGDFHIGQILKTKDSQNLWVIDFEGDPMGNNDEAPNKLRDIASMCGSFFHVGAVAIKYGADSKKIKKWIIDTQERYLANYFGQQPFDLQQLQRLIRSLEDRELEYADKFLTYWRYAPEFAISYMKELGYGSN